MNDSGTMTGKLINGTIRVSTALQNRGRELPLWQNALLGATFWVWVFSILIDIRQLFTFKTIDPEQIFGFYILLFVFGFVFLVPLSFTVRGGLFVADYLKTRWREEGLLNNLVSLLGWLIYTVVLIVYPLYFFLGLKLIALSKFPFLTAVSAVIWLCIGMSMTKFQPLHRRVILIPLILLFILSSKFVG